MLFTLSGCVNSCTFINIPQGNHPNIVSFIGAVTKSHPVGEQLNEDTEGDRGKQKDGEENIEMEEGEAKKLAITNKLCLVLEFCPKGSLFDCLINRREKVTSDSSSILTFFQLSPNMLQ